MEEELNTTRPDLPNYVGPDEGKAIRDPVGDVVTAGLAYGVTKAITPIAKILGPAGIIDAGINIATGESDTPFEKKLEIFKPAKVAVKGTRLLYENLLEDVFDNRILDTRNRHESITRFSTLQKQTKNRNILDEYVHKKAVEGPHKNWQDQGIPQTELSSEISDLARKNDLQLRAFDNVPSEVRRTMAWESGLKDGIFDYDTWKSKTLKGKTYRSRLTASMIETAHKEGVSFTAYRDNIVMPAFKKEWQPILKKLGINPKNLELHHIGALKASVGLYDGLQYGSKEWNAVTEALLKRYVKLGDVPSNLIPVVGSRTDPGTPHYIAHKYLDDIVGPIGEYFFTPEIRRQMKSNPAERIRIANEYADVVKKSEQIVVQAQEIWDLSYKGDVPESLVEKLLDNPAIFDETYQPPQLRNMVQTAIDDLDAAPLKRDIPNALIDVFERIDAGENMILDLINDPKLTSRKAIQRHNIVDPRNKQLVLKAVKSIKTLTSQQVQRIMQAYGKGGKGGISYNIDDIIPNE